MIAFLIHRSRAAIRLHTGLKGRINTSKECSLNNIINLMIKNVLMLLTSPTLQFLISMFPLLPNSSTILPILSLTLCNQFYQLFCRSRINSHWDFLALTILWDVCLPCNPMLVLHQISNCFGTETITMLRNHPP